ncbi:YCF48-related protein [Algoriphagus sp.]|uniref:YCF48-related protein n=1 Tax=Algoriphagus sp. TaxID=1872435 RepID=UPI0039191E6D
MKKLLSLFFLLFFLSATAWTQTWSRMQSWGVDLESVHWIDDQRGVAVGERLIIKTLDGGTTWEEVLQKFENHLFDVDFIDKNRGVAVGEKGTIYTTSNGGLTWESKTSGSQNDLLSVANTFESQLIAVGKNGEILHSYDAGNSWSKIPSGTNLRLNNITAVNENTIFIAGDEGRVIKSFDMGSTWTTSIVSPPNNLFGIVFSNEMTGYAVGEKGAFYKTTNGGQTWASVNSNTTKTLRKVAFSPVDIRVIVAVGDSAAMVRTVNSGATFGTLNLGATNFRNLKSIGFKPNLGQASSIGQDGYMINSTNSGASWAQKFAGIRNNFTSVDFKNLTTGFISGENGALFVTSNGAATLVSRPIPESVKIQTIDFWNTAFGYTSSAEGKIYRTGNSGTTWVPVFLPVNRTLSGFYLFAPSVVYAAGNNGYITRSTDSGVTWDQTIRSNTAANLKDIVFFDFAVGFAMGDNGQISWSFGGTEWENIPKVTSSNLNALAKLDTTRALIVGDGGIILKTEDKARNWRIIQSGTTKNLNSIAFFGQNIGFIAGDEGLALVTLDGGETWIQSPSGTTRNFSGVSPGTDSRAYFVGEDGTILSYTCTPPVGTLGEISGNPQSCVSNEIYRVTEMPISGSEIIWRVDGGEIISGQGTNQIEVKWTIPGRNAVLVSRSNFCGSGQTSALEVNVKSLPTNNMLISGEGIGCVNNISTYSLPNLEGTTYKWTVIGGEISSGQGTNKIEVKWDQAGDQLISVTQENRCGPSDPILKVVKVTAAPNQPSAISGQAQTALGEQYYEIAGLPGLDYRWTISGGGRIISGQGTKRVLVNWDAEGDFQLTVEAQNECGFGPKQNLAVNVNIITALEPSVANTLKIYPNPSYGTLTLSSPNLDAWSSLVIFNAMGQLIENRNISIGQSEIFLNGLPRGLILIQLQGKNGVLTRKVLVK